MAFSKSRKASLRRLHPVLPKVHYTHHGLYSGDGRVAHYAGWSKPGQPGLIEEVSLEEFKGVYNAWQKDHDDARFNGEQAVKRAHGLERTPATCLPTFCSSRRRYQTLGSSGAHMVTDVHGAMLDAGRPSVTASGLALIMGRMLIPAPRRDRRR
ncbi:MAG: hypothetical protein ACKVP7_01885 [Hyphomicrobiaceae bacterium]